MRSTTALLPSGKLESEDLHCARQSDKRPRRGQKGLPTPFSKPQKHPSRLSAWVYASGQQIRGGGTCIANADNDLQWSTNRAGGRRRKGGGVWGGVRAMYVPCFGLDLQKCVLDLQHVFIRKPLRDCVV